MRLRAVALLALCLANAAALGSDLHNMRDDSGRNDRSLKESHLPYLYVWAGATNDSLSKDSVFVISLSKATFGTIVRQVETPYNGLEPHHAGITVDKKYLGVGGLLSVLSGKPNVLFFDITTPDTPKLVQDTEQPQQSAITDDFLPTPDGGFLVTMMGAANGGSPGRLVKYDSDRKIVAEAPSNETGLLGYPGFNPHGVAADFVRGTMLTTDFIDPSTTLTMVPGPVVHRSTVRLWDYPAMVQTHVIDIAKYNTGGNVGAALIGTSGNYYFTGGNNLFWVDPKKPTKYKVAADLGTYLHMIVSFAAGTRAVVTAPNNSTVFLLNTKRQANPKILQQVYLGEGAGAHTVAVSPDEAVVAVSTYFLDELTAGKVHAAGDRTVRLFKLNKAKTLLSPHQKMPVIDFKTVVASKGVFNPHGLAFLAST